MIDYHKQLTMKDPGVPKVEKEFSWMSRSTLLKIKVSKVGFSSDAIEEPQRTFCGIERLNGTISTNREPFLLRVYVIKWANVLLMVRSGI